MGTNGNFKDGTYVNDSGYLRISAGPLRGQYVHKVVAKAKWGREIDPRVEEIHHRDDDKLNPDPDNLELLPIPEHRAHENKKRARARRAKEIAEGLPSRAEEALAERVRDEDGDEGAPF